MDVPRVNNEFESKVFLYLQDHPDSAAKDVAKALALNKSDLNKFLYAQKNKGNLTCDGATPPKWKVLKMVGLPSKETEVSDLTVIIFVDNDGKRNLIPIMENTLPYLSEEVVAHVISPYGIAIPGSRDQYTRNYFNEEDPTCAAQILLTVYISNFHPRNRSQGIHFIIVADDEASKYVAKLFAESRNVHYVSEGWDGLKMHLE